MAAMKRGVRPAGVRMMTPLEAAFYAGTGAGVPPTPPRKSANDELREQLESERARTARETAAKEKATLAANVALALAGHGLDAVQIKRAQNMVQSERDRCTKAQERFDYSIALASAQHAVRQQAGKPTVAPNTGPVFPAPGRKPMTWQEVQAERDRYRQRLRELGLSDPATGSIPAGNGLLGSR